MRSDQINSDVHYEHRDVNIRAMAWLGAAIVVTAVVLHVALYFLYAGFRAGAVESGRVSKAEEPALKQASAQPRLQVDPITDINQLKADENKKLTSYGWVNREKGVVRIPIEQAMKLLADRGFATAHTQDQSVYGTQRTQLAPAKKK